MLQTTTKSQCPKNGKMMSLGWLRGKNNTKYDFPTLQCFWLCKPTILNTQWGDMFQ